MYALARANRNISKSNISITMSVARSRRHHQHRLGRNSPANISALSSRSPPVSSSSSFSGAAAGSGLGLGLGSAASASTSGGAGLNQLDVRAKRILLDIDRAAHHPLNARNASMRPPPVGANKKTDDDTVEAKLSVLDSVLGSMERLIPTERRPEKRDIWKKRLQSLRQRCALHRVECDRRKRAINQRDFEERQRMELFGDASEKDHVINMTLAGEHDSLMRSNQMADDLISLSRSTIESLEKQGTSLRGAHRKLLDMANTLGLSSALLRVIEKREWVDALITYGCMVFTLVFIYVLYRFTLGQGE